MRIAFATTSPEIVGTIDVDRPWHESAFARAGVALDHCLWWDPSVPWSDYDLVVIRSPWDYVERVGEFRAWLQRVGAHGSLRNPAPLVSWNLDKRYLLDLQSRGLPVVPTTVAATVEEVRRALRRHGDQVVVKPTVSAGSRDTGRFAADDPRALALGERILALGFEVLVQPCVASVGTAGETATVLFDGVISHSFRKGPILAEGGGFLGGAYAEDVTPVTLNPAQRLVVERVTQGVNEVAGERFGVAPPLLYARVDLVALDDGREVVLEVELAEPAFYLSVDPAAPERFVAAVERHADGGGGHRPDPAGSRP